MLVLVKEVEQSSLIMCDVMEVNQDYLIALLILLVPIIVSTMKTLASDALFVR